MGPPLKLVEVCCPSCGADKPRAYASGRDFEYETCDGEFSFLRCGACGALYLSPRPDLSALDVIYPPEYAPYHFDEERLMHRARNFFQKRGVPYFRALLAPAADILDAGCGTPAYVELLRKHGSPGWKLWGNDFSARTIAELQRRGFQTLPGRFEDIDLPEGSFDAIFLRQVLEHLDCPMAVINRAAGLLKTGGRLIIETPNFDAWDARLFKKRYWGGYHFPRHWTVFNPEIISAAGKKAGLATEKISFMLSPSFWVQSLHHGLQDHGWPRLARIFFTYVNPVVMGCAVMADLAQLALTGKTSNMRVILRKPIALSPG